MQDYDQIYFDNDLGKNKEMYKILKALLILIYAKKLDFSWMKNKKFFVHSKNIVASKNIIDLLTNGYELENVDYLLW